MADAVIGALRVTLALDSGEFSKGADKAHSKASSLEKGLTDIAKRIGVAFAALKIGEAIDKQLDAVNSLRKLSEQTGIGIEELSKFQYAAQAAGVSIEQLSTAIDHYNKNISEAVRDPTNKMAQAFALMGISLEDANGKYKTFSALTLEAADKISTYNNGVEKAALVTAGWGKSSEEFINFLNKGSAGIRAAGDEARRFGLVLDEVSARQVKEAEEATRKLNAQWDGLVRTAAINLAPALAKLAEWMGVLVSQFGALNRLSQKELSDEIDTTTAALKAEREEMERLKNSTTGYPWIDKVQEGPVDAQIRRLEDKLKDLMAEWDRRALHIEVKLEAPKFSIFDAFKNDFDAFEERLKGMPLLLRDSFAFDTNPFRMAMEKINNLENLGIITAQNAAKMRIGLQRQEQDAVLNTATVVGDSLVKVFGKSKLASAAQAIINTAVGVTKALALEGPLGWIQAAAIAAAGAAQLATIQSQTATGGSGSVAPVGGPPSGGDAGPATAPTGSANSSTLFVEGINASGLFTGQAVRDLISRINDAVKDGATLVLK